MSMHILSKLLNNVVAERKFGYHHKCKTVNPTHLCFADDLMVFTDGKLRSMEGIIAVFEEFTKIYGLKISLEKLTIYLAGVSRQ